MNLSFSQWLSNLRQKPYKVRLRILWITIGVVGLILLALFALSLKNQIAQLGNKPLLPELDNKGASSFESTNQHITVESVQTQNNIFKIFFKVENKTDDILNFSKAEDIKLQVDNQTLAVIRITDRQNKPFVQKILSHTSNFGVVYFPPVEALEGLLTFDSMYFERTPTTLFKETIELDFIELSKSQELRR